MSCQCFHLSKCFLVFYTGSSIWYVRKNFRKKYIFCLLIRTRMCASQGVRNISFFRKFCLRAIWMIPMVCCGILENIEKIGLLERNNEKCPYSEFFQSVFSRIRTRKTPNTDTFHAVKLIYFRLDNKLISYPKYFRMLPRCFSRLKMFYN